MTNNISQDSITGVLLAIEILQEMVLTGMKATPIQLGEIYKQRGQECADQGNDEATYPLNFLAERLLDPAQVAKRVLLDTTPKGEA